MSLQISSNYDYLPVVVLSYITFMFIYTFVSPTLGNLFSSTYPGLKHSSKIEWDNRFTSTVFSVVVSAVSLYVLVVDKAIQLSPLKIIGDVFTLLHHSFSVVGYGYALTYSVMPYFANFRLICELSTPLVNMR